MADPLVVMEGIEKSFPGVHALGNCRYDLNPGEVHALVGENGAGKSTLMKILAGVYQRDSGRIIYKGREVNIPNPRAAQHLGISIIHQELNLMPHLTAGQNIFIGREPRQARQAVPGQKRMNDKARELFGMLRWDINRVARILREKGLGARPKRRFRVTTKSAQGPVVAENKLDRHFWAAAVNQKWVSDITYVATAEGWLYLCVIVDLYSRRVVGWSMGTSLAAELVTAAFMMAVITRQAAAGTDVSFRPRHAIRKAGAFRKGLMRHGMSQSMSRKGECSG